MHRFRPLAVWSIPLTLFFLAVWGNPSGSSRTIHADDDLDRQLLESLEDRRTSDSPVTIVNRLLANTESAHRRLAAGEFDEQTSSIQQQILEDIDALLEHAGSSPPSGSPAPAPPGGSQSPASAEQSPGESSPEAETTPGDSSSKQGTTPADDPNAPSRESAERTAAGEETEAERDRRLGLATAAWGHLPPKVREQMRSAFSETYLPKYDELVRRYYEALAARREGQERSVPPSPP